MITRTLKNILGLVRHRFIRPIWDGVKISVGLAIFSVAGAAELPEFTSFQPTITEVIDPAGFRHPGVGLTKNILVNARTQIIAQQEPWYSYYKEMVQSGSAARNVVSSNASTADPTTPLSTAFNSQGFNSRFIADGLKVYTQSLLYYFTGDEVYRTNAMNIVRVWQKMDPAQYTYFTDAVIHTGVPMNRMLTGVEILRYTDTQNSALTWTDEDTNKLTANLIIPAVDTFMHTNGAFMNQHTYAVQGAMASYIFTGNTERYKEVVEWMTVNKTAPNQGFNGSIKRLFRLVEKNAKTGEILDTPVVQHVEMGRDQAHGGGDLTNAAIIARMFYAQDTKVDPITGEVSDSSNAVGMYEFLGDRVLHTADYFWSFMAGYETDWVPTEYSIFSDGRVGGVYDYISRAYRGRMSTTNFWDLYYYYTYQKGVDVATIAPYFYQAFKKRIPSIHYHGRAYGNTWDTPDAGADFWLYIPVEAVQEGAANLPKPQLSASIIELEERYTAFDSNSQTVNESNIDFIRLESSPAQTKIALIHFNYGGRPATLLYGIKLRTNGIAKLTLSADHGIAPYIELEVPNTQNEWRYVVYDVGTAAVTGIIGDSIAYMAAVGDGTVIDIDHINVNAGSELSAPYFVGGNKNEVIYSYSGASIALNLAAADPSSVDSIGYSIDQLPVGSNFDEQSGMFTWFPSTAGTYAFQIAASDGSSTTAKRITVVVESDRESAIARVSQGFNSDNVYSSESLNNYQLAHTAAITTLNSSSDAVFQALLEALLQATNNLKLVSPNLADGSLDYASTVTSSTFGTGISSLIDSDAGTFAGFRRTIDLYHILDFGIDHKVNASAFGIQARTGFPDRGAGVTVYASNDFQNWIRITSDESAYQVGMSVLPVDSAYQEVKYRYFKIQMIHPQPDSLREEILNIYELGELRVYGQRFAIDNKIESVNVDAGQIGVNGLVYSNGQLTLNITTKEAVQNLLVKVRGIDAQATTQDGVHWLVNVNLGMNITGGSLDYYLQYTLPSTGEINDAVIQSGLYLTDGTNVINNIPAVANFIDPSTSFGRPNTTVTAQQVGALFDNDAGTISDFRLGGNGSGGYIAFDFKQGGSVSLKSVDILARQDGYFGRIGGTVIQASNDNQTWTTISSAAQGIVNWQLLTISDQNHYRYIRIYNGGNWFGNMAEVKFHGNYQAPVDVVQSVSLSSPQAVSASLIKKGDTAIVTFTTSELITDINVTIQGVAAAVEQVDDLTWRAIAVISQAAAKGYLNFAINYASISGSTGVTETQVTDTSRLYLIEAEDLLTDLASTTTLLDPTTTGGRPNTTITAAQVASLFDSNISTFSDFRAGSNGAGGYITFDFKEGNSIWFAGLDILARQDQYYTRINGTVVQGSVDNVNWATISSTAIATKDWQTLNSTAQNKYRYIRIYNYSNWFGNVAEVRFHADVIAPITSSDAPQGWINQDVLVTLTATDNYSGVDNTYFSQGSTEMQVGTGFAITTEGTNDVIFWSEDKAGNIEPLNRQVIQIDKTAPAAQFLSDEKPLTSGTTIEDYRRLDVKVSDAVSGLQFLNVHVDDRLVADSPDQETVSLSFAGKLGLHKIVVSAKDFAGNQYEQVFTVNVVTSVESLLYILKEVLQKVPASSPLVHKLEKVMANMTVVSQCEANKKPKGVSDPCIKSKFILLRGLIKFYAELHKEKIVSQLDTETILIIKTDIAALIKYLEK